MDEYRSRTFPGLVASETIVVPTYIMSDEQIHVDLGDIFLRLWRANELDALQSPETPGHPEAAKLLTLPRVRSRVEQDPFSLGSLSHQCPRTMPQWLSHFALFDYQV